MTVESKLIGRRITEAIVNRNIVFLTFEDGSTLRIEPYGDQTDSGFPCSRLEVQYQKGDAS